MTTQLTVNKLLKLFSVALKLYNMFSTSYSYAYEKEFGHVSETTLTACYLADCYRIRKKICGGFNFVVIVDNKDPQIFFTMSHEI